MGLRILVGIYLSGHLFVAVSDDTFWSVVLGLLQGIVWPAYVIYFHVLLSIGA